MYKTPLKLSKMQIRYTTFLLKGLNYAFSLQICIVPGYGLAVAQAQGDLAAVANKLGNN